MGRLPSRSRRSGLVIAGRVMVEHDEFVREVMQNDNVAQNNVNVHEGASW